MKHPQLSSHPVSVSCHPHNQTCHAWFILGKSMLNCSQYLLGFLVPSMSSRRSHSDFPMDWSKAEQPVIPEGDLLAHLGQECNVHFPPVIGDPSPTDMSFRDDREQICKDFISSFSSLGCSLSQMNPCRSSPCKNSQSLFTAGHTPACWTPSQENSDKVRERKQWVFQI